MASKFSVNSNNFRFSYRSKYAGIPLFIVLYVLYNAFLLNFTTCTFDYTLEKLPYNSIQPQPDAVLLSLRNSLSELRNVSSHAQQLESNNPKTLEALHNCTFLFKVATRHLEDLMNLLKIVSQGDKVLAAPEILGLQVLVKASVACQEKCLDGLEKMGSEVLNDFRVRVQRSKQCTSNSLAIFSETYPVGLRASRRRICLFSIICVTDNL